MRMPIPHILPVCRVYLRGCGCGWMLGETLMESWEREDTVLQGKKRGTGREKQKGAQGMATHRSSPPF